MFFESLNCKFKILFDVTFSIEEKMDFSLFITGVLCLILLSMKKLEENFRNIIGIIGMEVFLGRSISPIVRKVIQRIFHLH